LNPDAGVTIAVDSEEAKVVEVANKRYSDLLIVKQVRQPAGSDIYVYTLMLELRLP
jgi:hypothetical protein